MNSYLLLVQLETQLISLGGEPPSTYSTTIDLALREDRIHSIILGYWHTIITPPMVFAELLADAVGKAREDGIDKPVVCSLVGDVEVEEACEFLNESKNSCIPVYGREAGCSIECQVQMDTHGWKTATCVILVYAETLRYSSHKRSQLLLAFESVLPRENFDWLCAASPALHTRANLNDHR